jgi:Ras GTPase-activating-like protein IQGAP2/3
MSRQTQRKPVGIVRNESNDSGRFNPSTTAQAAVFAARHGLPIGSAKAASPQGTGSNSDRRYSVAALWSMAAENDAEVDDELTKGIYQLLS